MARSPDAPDGAGDGEAPAFSLVRRQLESLNVDNMMLRRAVEDLCAEIRSSSSRAPGHVAAAGRGEGRVAATAQPPPQPYHAFPSKPECRTAPEKAATPGDVGEELKKALKARLR